MERPATLLSSPIRWVGGKSKLRTQVIACLPTQADAYVEAFAGAAWVLFGKTPHPIEVLNDANGDLVNLYRVLKWRPAALLDEVQFHLHARSFFMEWKEQPPDPGDELRRAAWFYMLIMSSFGADVSHLSSATFGTWATGPRRLFGLRGAETFLPAAQRLQNVLIEQMDACALIARYDRPGTLFFCDPPYVETCGYQEGFGEDDHRRLAAALRQIAGRFLLTVNDHPLVRDLYGGWATIRETSEARSKSRQTEGRQRAPILFIANYPLPALAASSPHPAP